LIIQTCSMTYEPEASCWCSNTVSHCCNQKIINDTWFSTTH